MTRSMPTGDRCRTRCPVERGSTRSALIAAAFDVEFGVRHSAQRIGVSPIETGDFRMASPPAAPRTSRPQTE